jgi:hypothetical protein
MTDSTKRSVWLWVGLFGFWTVMGLFMFSQGMAQKVLSGDKHSVGDYFVSWMVGVWLWFAFTPLILWLGRKFPLDRKPYWRGILIHLPISFIFPLVDLTVEAVILHALHLFPDIMTSVPAALVFLLIIGYHQAVLTYWTILGGQCAYGWYRRYEERRQAALRLELRSSQLERQLAEAHLSALKMQLHPHFLFNTLNTIMVLVRQQKGREAEEMLARLSDLLRCVLEDVQAQEVPLSRESWSICSSIYPSSRCAFKTACTWTSPQIPKFWTRPCRIWRCSRSWRMPFAMESAAVPRRGSSALLPAA